VRRHCRDNIVDIIDILFSLDPQTPIAWYILDMHIDLHIRNQMLFSLYDEYFWFV